MEWLTKKKKIASLQNNLVTLQNKANAQAAREAAYYDRLPEIFMMDDVDKHIRSLENFGQYLHEQATEDRVLTQTAYDALQTAINSLVSLRSCLGVAKKLLPLKQKGENHEK